LEDIYRLLKPQFELPPPNYTGSVSEVYIGATRDEKGTRRYRLRLGGQRWLPFFSTTEPTVTKPILAMQVFDTPAGIPPEVCRILGDIVEDPVHWCKVCVEGFKAEAVALTLTSTAPAGQDRSPEEAAKLVEQVIEAVDVPLIIIGSGDAGKDPLVLEKVAEATVGERCLIASATLSSDYRRVAEAAIENGHVVLASTDCDPVSQRTLNMHLLSLGLKPSQLVMDPTTAALGYGLEYSISIIEQIRLNALKGDECLQMPIAAITSQSWTAREALTDDLVLGPLSIRGPLWEVHTAVHLFLAGAELFIMLHPEAVVRFREVVADMLLTGEPYPRTSD